MANLYQLTRKAGPDPNYWYAMARSDALPRGAVKEAVFWERSIALFRSHDGVVGAIANSCAHRRIKLTLGTVSGNHLACAYHGWEYDATGRVAHIPHDLFGRPMPDLCVRAYPVRERYGLIWIFPGDLERAAETPLPPFPEMEGQRPWASVKFDLLWRAHFSIIVENLLDFSHAYLHRRSRAFENVVLTHSEADGTRVTADYDASIGNGRILGRFVNRGQVNTKRISTCFEYPYQRASIGGKIKHWCFLAPRDLHSTQLFFTIVIDRDALRFPFTPLRLPHRSAQHFLDVAKKIMIAPLIDEDRRAVEAEQEAVDTIPEVRAAELNPVTRLVQELIVQKWAGGVQSQSRRSGNRANTDRSHGDGPMTTNAPPAAAAIAPHEFLMQLGTTGIPHSGRSLYEHLAGVSAILHAWRQPEEVHLAGMFHSIYSTEKYRHATLPMSERGRLREVIGEEAERLVYLFAALPAATLLAAAEAGKQLRPCGSIELPCHWHQPASVRVSKVDFAHLIAIHIANRLEQSTKPATGIGFWLSRLSSETKPLHSFPEALPAVVKDLPAIAVDQERQLNSLYLQGTACLQSREAQAALPYLERACGLCGVVGEPFVMLGVALLLIGDREGARRTAAKGRDILNAWGTPWHKHLTLERWCALAGLVEAEAPAEEIFPVLAEMRAAQQRAQRVVANEMHPEDSHADTPEPPNVEAGAAASRLFSYLQRIQSERSRRAIKWYPGLGRKSWYDAADFAAARELEARFAEIKAEALQVRPSCYFEESEDIGRTGSWQVCMFYEQGRRNEEVCQQCPAITAVLEGHESIRRSAGLIYLSRMAPHTHVAAHQARGNIRLRCHLALSIPEGDCAIRVGDEIRRWEEGKCIIFDDSFEHEVWNRTDEPRLVLLVDLWHPDLTEPERNALEAINWMSMDRARAMLGTWQRNDGQRQSERHRTAALHGAGQFPGVPAIGEPGI